MGFKCVSYSVCRSMKTQLFLVLDICIKIIITVDLFKGPNPKRPEVTKPRSGRFNKLLKCFE